MTDSAVRCWCLRTAYEEECINKLRDLSWILCHLLTACSRSSRCGWNFCGVKCELVCISTPDYRQWSVEPVLDTSLCIAYRYWDTFQRPVAQRNTFHSNFIALTCQRLDSKSPPHGIFGMEGFPIGQHNNISCERQSGDRAVSRVHRLPLLEINTEGLWARPSAVYLPEVQQEGTLCDAVQHWGPYPCLLCIYFQTHRWGEMCRSAMDVWTSGKQVVNTKSIFLKLPILVQKHQFMQVLHSLIYSICLPI